MLSRLAISEWESLATFPSMPSEDGLFFIYQECIYGVDDSGVTYKYLSRKNVWIKQKQIEKLPTQYNTISRHGLQQAFDPTCNTLYMMNNRGTLARIQIHDNRRSEWIIGTGATSLGTKNGSLISINGKLNVIGGLYNCGHKQVIYDDHSLRCEQLHNFRECMKIYRTILQPRVIKAGKKVFIFGAKGSGKICEYDIDKDEWTKLKIRMPIPISPRSGLMTTVCNDEYVLMFGRERGSHCNDIWIFSVQTKLNRWRKSKITCQNYLNSLLFRISTNQVICCYVLHF